MKNTNDHKMIFIEMYKHLFMFLFNTIKNHALKQAFSVVYKQLYLLLEPVIFYTKVYELKF